MPKTLAVSSLVDAAVAAVHEGCVAETLAALQAYEQLYNARDLQVRSALRRVAEDEARHAALAFQFVRWALSTGGEQVCAAVSCAFAAAREKLMTSTPRAEEPGLEVATWRAHGRLTSAEEQSCRLAGLRDVIEPCALALLQVAAQVTA
jgi:hypothetical protein